MLLMEMLVHMPMWVDINSGDNAYADVVANVFGIVVRHSVNPDVNVGADDDDDGATVV